MSKLAKIDRTKQVPYLCGYSISGDTVYIDRRLPKELKLRDGRSIKVDDFLVVHEVTEKALMDRLGYTYPEAHLMAEAAERFACHRHGVPWDEYQSFCEYWIEATSHEYHDIPVDIDLKPERDTKDEASLHTFLDIIKSKYKLKSLR